MKDKRPIGVILIGWIYFSLTTFMLGMSLWIFILSFREPELAHSAAQSLGQKTMEEFRHFIMVCWAFYLPLFIATIGILWLREWGRKLFVISLLANLLYNLAILLSQSYIDRQIQITVGVVSLVFHLGIVVYFTRPKIRLFFS